MNDSGKSEILVVEDNRLTRNLLVKMLKGGGFQVLQAENLEEALDLYAQRRPAAVTIDLQLGDQSGEDLMRRILARNPNARVVVVTAEAPAAMRERLLRGGARGYIEKPLLDPAEVLRVIQGAMADQPVRPAKTSTHAPSASSFPRSSARRPRGVGHYARHGYF